MWSGVERRPAGISVHRRRLAPGDAIAVREGIPVTNLAWTLIDLAGRLGPEGLEAAINEADRLDLANPDELRWALTSIGPRPGVRTMRNVLDRRTFTLTDSELERRFLRLVRAAALPVPQVGCRLNGFKVDFYWPELGLVVETDGLRYHRTPAQQTRDRLRDQVHVAAGLTTLRFTHAQVRFDANHVIATLVALARRTA